MREFYIVTALLSVAVLANQCGEVQAQELISLRTALNAEQTWGRAAFVLAGPMSVVTGSPVATEPSKPRHLDRIERIVSENRCTLMWHGRRRHGEHYKIECRP